MAAVCLCACVKAGEAPATPPAALSGSPSASVTRLAGGMDPAMIRVAQRHDGSRRTDFWGRTNGWETYDLRRLPTLPYQLTGEEDARFINGLRPGSMVPPPPAKAFILKANTEDRAQAELCLTQAIYYEAATEPLEGQQAVAQTVLNRMRHPGYPKSVCGVVYEGAMRPTGCQFSFTCDGALGRAPNAALWRQAKGVAAKALDGYVMRAVGTATHYHADYVAPYWAPTLYKIVQIGRHIFYRWTGPQGLPPAFVGRYAGHEKELSAAVLQGYDERIQGLELTSNGGALQINPTEPGKTVVLDVAGEVRTYTVNTLGPDGGTKVRIQGSLTPSRRQPTPQEIADINAKLKALEDPDAPVATSSPASSGAPAGRAGDLPLGPPKP